MSTPAKSGKGKNENESDVVESLLKLNSEEISKLPSIDEKREFNRKDFTKEIQNEIYGMENKVTA
jgi:hypothetical protein